MESFDLKQELAQQAGELSVPKEEIRLTRDMTIPDMVKAMMP